RIPILFCGPLLHRLGQAFIPDLGGCRIGDRPIDFHLEVLRKFGAVVEKTDGGIRLTAPQRLRGTKVKLPYPSVGATEQVLLTAVRAEGVT
ncbi:UDP-N-acetylglucosamine 1-carboxyvinyltransferase, partial [Mycoplasma flocculare]|nr:UDP-N-acetylglucosamine 1-carboxyvinyltransferase [Mesomycoplasma flocculare]